jgi:CBS domain-containing protein
MSNEGVSSVAVVDNAANVIGNISTADTKLLTNTSSLPLLQSTCIHFISVILTERGIGDGKDSFPGMQRANCHEAALTNIVFHVNPYSTLAHTVAKLVATRSHRMWVVESASPSPSAPATPSLQSAVIAQPLGGSVPPSPSFPAVSAAALPGARISGRLTGVISLSDILNLFARTSGLNPKSPDESRARRRRSSSTSLRPSLDGLSRSSIDLRR